MKRDDDRRDDVMDFYNTRAGRILVDGTLPRIAEALETIARNNGGGVADMVSELGDEMFAVRKRLEAVGDMLAKAQDDMRSTSQQAMAVSASGRDLATAAIERVNVVSDRADMLVARVDRATKAIKECRRRIERIECDVEARLDAIDARLDELYQPEEAQADEEA